MTLEAPPCDDIVLSFGRKSPKFNDREKTAFVEMWSVAWPAYREVLLELFSSYEYEDLLKKKAQVSVEKLIPSKETNDGANLLLRFSFDDTGITWDIFQKDRTIVHAQPAF